MNRRIKFRLTTEQLTPVERAMHHASQVKVRQRATAIRMLHLGHKAKSVDELLAVTSSPVCNWHRRYRAQGLAGLADHPKSCRPVNADVTYVQQLAKALDTDPRDFGYGFSVWTINKVRLHLAETTVYSSTQRREPCRTIPKGKVVTVKTSTRIFRQVPPLTSLC